MTDLDPDHMLQQALTGERAHDDPALIAALATSPGLRARFSKLRALAVRLDREGMVQRAAAVAPADQTLPPFDLRQVRGRARWRGLRSAALVVAALLICALAVWWTLGQGSGRALPSTYTLANPWRLSPAGACAVLPETFTWHDPRGSLSRNQSYFVVFSDVSGAEIDAIELDRDAQWSAQPAVLRSLPRPFRWEVQVRVGTELVRRSGAVEVRVD